MREEIEEWIESYERLVEENLKMKSVVIFWRTKWIEEQQLPDRFDADRKERIRNIFLLRNVSSTDPQNDLNEACKVFDSHPRVN
jgi:glycogen debranching enzyme